MSTWYDVKCIILWVLYAYVWKVTLATTSCNRFFSFLMQSKPLLLLSCPVLSKSFATPWIGIFQAILEWVAISFSTASSWPKGPNFHPLLLLLHCRQILHHGATGANANIGNGNANSSCGDYWESSWPMRAPALIKKRTSMLPQIFLSLHGSFLIALPPQSFTCAIPSAWMLFLQISSQFTLWLHVDFCSHTWAENNVPHHSHALPQLFSRVVKTDFIYYTFRRKLSTEELMLLNCGVGEDSWESLGLQGDPTSPFWRRSALGFLWNEWR